MLQGWKEVCHQVFEDWEVQTVWNLQKNMWCVCKKNVYNEAKRGFDYTSLSQNDSLCIEIILTLK